MNRDLLTKKNAERIGASLGKVVEVQNPVEDGGLVIGFLRCRVEIDLADPLKDGFWVPCSNGDRRWASRRCEKLLDFCYNCGCIGHSEKMCDEETVMAIYDPALPRYGPWMRTAAVRKTSEEFPPVVHGGRGNDAREANRQFWHVGWKGGNIRGSRASREGRGGTWDPRNNRLLLADVEGRNEVTESKICELLEEKAKLNSTIVHKERSGSSTRKENLIKMGSTTIDGVTKDTPIEALAKAPAVITHNESSNENNNVTSERIVVLSREDMEITMEKKSKQTIEPELSINLVCSPVKKKRTPRKFRSSSSKKTGSNSDGALMPRAVSSEECNRLNEQGLNGVPVLVHEGALRFTAGGELKDLNQKYRPSLLFLSETRMKKERALSLRMRLGFHNGVCVEPIGLSGGLCLWWKEDLKVEILSKKRLIFWDELREVAAAINGAWVLGGDFNEVLTSDEKKGGLPLENRRVIPFHDVICDCELMDMGFKGQRFTWENRQEANIKERLDKCLINVRWRTLFVNAQCFNLPAIGEDINNEWQGQNEENWILEVIKRLKKCKNALINWSKKAFPNNRKEIDELMKELAKIQDNSFILEEQGRVEEKCKQNIKDPKLSCNWVENEEGIERIFLRHFMDLFRSSGSKNWYEALSHVDRVVTDDMNDELLREVTEEEIKVVAYDMGAIKSPGYLPQKLNKTNIVLIPKVPNPEEVGQFRPISLCNYMYKVISKVLVNRMKGMLTDIITPSQCAFVPQRQIQNNIFIILEAFHHLRLKKSKKDVEVGLKLDMNKAYDRVEWDFLKEVMKKIGFASKWVDLIMECVTTMSYALVINGNLSKPFLPSRGLRQDDSLFFLKADAENCRRMAGIIEHYCEASGQQENFQKSGLFFSTNCPEDIKRECSQIFNIPYTENPGEQTNIWEHSWIPDLNGATLKYTPEVEEQLPRKVNEIMDAESRSWQLESIAHRISEEEAEAILEVPINDTGGDDEMIWRHEKNGKFTVRSAYHMYKETEDRRLIQMPSSSHTIPEKFWKFIWSIFCPNKIKNFLWKVGANIVPTMENLFKKKVIGNPLCTICNEKAKTVEHLLLLCPWTEHVWFEGCTGLRIDKESITCFSSWWLDSFDSKGIQKNEVMRLVARAAFLIWYIWKGRNVVQFNGKKPNAEGSVRRAEMAWKEFELANSDNAKQGVIWEAGNLKWSPPSEGNIKINVDGAFEVGKEEAAIGVVARDSTGSTVAVIGRKVKASTCQRAEMLAVREGVKLAGDRNWVNAELETDSKEALLNCTRGDGDCAWRVEPIVKDIRIWSGEARGLKMKWIPRLVNEATNFVAVSCRKGMCVDNWAFRPPSYFVLILENDGLPGPP
ncbi:reverse transcriptase [Corchorus capsularis]|uniref:Reverse transcriptase n=1 Tax=Corchorus capsularis TaxID=210143 RepID=A0A1R3HS68_COCAP|nr:reverse transcriptase [Corchorus capsularis]